MKKLTLNSNMADGNISINRKLPFYFKKIFFYMFLGNNLVKYWTFFFISVSVLTLIVYYIAPSNNSSRDCIAVWIMCCLTLKGDGLYLDWYSSGRSFKSRTFTTYQQIGVPIAIPLCGIVWNDFFRLCHFIAQNCAIIANKV